MWDYFKGFLLPRNLVLKLYAKWKLVLEFIPPFVFSTAVGRKGRMKSGSSFSPKEGRSLTLRLSALLKVMARKEFIPKVGVIKVFFSFFTREQEKLICGFVLVERKGMKALKLCKTMIFFYSTWKSINIYFISSVILTWFSKFQFCHGYKNEIMPN